MSDSHLILIVEDEETLSELIAYHLKKEGFRYIIASDGLKAYEEMLKNVPDLIVLDLMLPNMNGLELCRRIRTHPKTEKTAILILSAKGEEIDRVVGFEIGADDYLVKPFSPRELILRIRAILKRQQTKPRHNSKPDFTLDAQASEQLTWQKLRLSITEHRCWVGDNELVLTATEFKLLRFFLRSSQRILTRDLLIDQVWGENIAITSRTVDTHIKRLREKLGATADCIETVRGVGYRLKNSA